jgi:hypothetical protein
MAVNTYTSFYHMIDYKWFIHLGIAGVKFGQIPQALANFRFHGASKTQNCIGFMQEVFMVIEKYGANTYIPSRLYYARFSLLQSLYQAKIFYLGDPAG